MVIRAPILATVIALSATIAGCGSSNGSGAGDGTVVINEVPESQQRVIKMELARPYVPTSKYASVLYECAFALDEDELCTLEKLPYIGQENANPSIQNILDRTIVTHDWMGDRFEQLLRAWPADVIPLFRSVTVIVIASDVRPSQFNAWRGRMKLDPQSMWLSLGEKRTVSQSPDFRASYGPDLKFLNRWRLVKDEDWAIPFSSLKDDNERELSDIIIGSVRTMYHELAHANDYMRAEALTDVDSQLSPKAAIDASSFSFMSNELYFDSGLTDDNSPLFSIALVLYRNDDPSASEQAILADSVGSLMEAEGRVRFYGYRSRAEDLATLFGATMLKLHYDVEIDTAFANKPEGYPDTNSGCNDLKIAWGTRNRLASPSVAPRAKYVTEKLIGKSARLDQLFESGLGQETSLAIGAGWCESISDNPAASNQLATDGRVRGDNLGINIH